MLAIADSHTCREVWRHCTIPGTFHAIAAAVWGMLQGRGFVLQLPNVPPQVKALITDANELDVDSPIAESPVADASSNVPTVTDW